jgi:hypothetical protein
MATIDVVSFLLALVGAGLGAVTFVVTGGSGLVSVLATVLIGGTGFVFGLLIGNALSGVAKTALYVYATESTAPEFFDDMNFGEFGGNRSAMGRVRDRFGGSSGGRS